MKKIKEFGLLIITILSVPFILLYLLGFMIAGLFVTGKKKCKVCGDLKIKSSICGGCIK